MPTTAKKVGDLRQLVAAKGPKRGLIHLRAPEPATAGSTALARRR